MGHIEKGLDYLDEAITRGFDPFAIKVVAVRCVPQSTVREVWAHPRHRAMMAQFGITDEWKDELLEKVNELTPITGITVRSPETG